MTVYYGLEELAETSYILVIEFDRVYYIRLSRGYHDFFLFLKYCLLKIMFASCYFYRLQKLVIDLVWMVVCV